MLKSFIFSLTIIFMTVCFCVSSAAYAQGQFTDDGFTDGGFIDDEQSQGPSTGQAIGQALIGITGQVLSSQMNKKKYSAKEEAKLEKEYDKLVAENDRMRGSCTDKILSKYPEVEGAGGMGLAGGSGIAGALGGLVGSFTGDGGKDYGTLNQKYRRQNARLKSACKVKSTYKTTTTTKKKKSTFSFGSGKKKTTTTTKKKTTTKKSPFSFGSFGSKKTSKPKTTTKTTTKKTTTTKKPSSTSKSKPSFSLPGLKLPSGSAVKGSLFDPKNFKED